MSAGGLVFVTSGYRGNRLAAIDLSAAAGDIRGSDAVVWSVDRDTPYVPSPLLLDGQLYVLKSNSGVLTAYDAATGAKRYGPERVPGIRNVYASPVAAAGRLYVTSRDGVTSVVRAGPSFEVLATNVLDDEFDAFAGHRRRRDLSSRTAVPLLHRGGLTRGVCGAPRSRLPAGVCRGGGGGGEGVRVLERVRVPEGLVGRRRRRRFRGFRRTGDT